MSSTRRCAAEERYLEPERQEEAQCCESCQETLLSPRVSPDLELPRKKGKEPELVLESEVVQELQRCNSCVKQNVECIRIKVSDQHW